MYQIYLTEIYSTELMKTITNQYRLKVPLMVIT